MLDTSGNLICRIGRYGNVDDGTPLPGSASGASGNLQSRIVNRKSIGGDEVALMHAQMLAVESDRRLFVGDLGNARIASVKLQYRAEEKVELKDVPDQAKAGPAGPR